MTTDKQRRANRSNAQKSTGPKTRSGRATSAANARRHGLTTPPPWDDVTWYYRIILNDPEATPDPMASDEGARAALALAECEAQRARCINAERAHLLRMYQRAGDGAYLTLNDIVNNLGDGGWDIDALKFALTREIDPEFAAMIKNLIRVNPDRTAALHRRIKTLRRYRREAETRRRKALARWIAVSMGERKTFVAG